MAPLLLRHQLMHRSSRLGRCIRLWEFPQFHHWRHPPRRGFHSKPRQADRGNHNRIRLSLCDQNVWENELSASPSPPANFVWAGTTRSDNRLCCRLRASTTLVAGWSHWSFGKPPSNQPPKILHRGVSVPNQWPIAFGLGLFLQSFESSGLSIQVLLTSTYAQVLRPHTGGNGVFICERNKDFILKFELVSFR